ncbi:cadherin-like domain-containing protein, partial [Microvirga sp. P5_D2]
MSTNTAASADIAALNYITLHADGKSDVDVKITEINGKLVFDVSVVPGSNPNLSTLQALYFNIKGLDLNESSTLKIEGALVTRSGVTADRAGLDGDSSNVNGHGGPYDVFVEFGTRGVTSASFTLYDPASTQPVLLNLLGGQTFGFRLDTPDDKIITNAPLAPNHAPVAANDTRHTNEDTPLTVAVADLLANDTDLDGNALTMTGVSQGAKGTVKLTDGKITYTPDPNFNGTDSFTYTVSDGQGGQTTATVTVMVAAVNDEPTGFPSKILAHGQEDTTYIVHAADLVEGLSDPDGDTLLVFGLKADKAQVVNNGDGTFTLTPDANYSGPISLTYNVVEGKGSSKVAHQSITFDPVNDAPVAAPVILPEGKQGQTIIITAAQLLAKASDVDGDVLTVSSLALSSKEGTLVNNGNGTWAYTPDAHYSGPVSFSYVVSDGSERASSTASLVLTPVKTEPGTGGSTPAGTYDDLIEASDGDDIIHGGRGNDEMQGEGGNDIIVGGTDNGSLGWTAGTLTNVTIGDNLYGNDGNDTYFYSKGDGVDLIWDFRPDADTIVLGYGSTEIIGATFVTGVTNR